MTAKKQSDGTWLVVRKDGTMGTRRFKTQKSALNAQRTARGNRGGKKPAKKGGRKGGGTSGDTTTTKRPPGTGKVYQATRLTALALAQPLESGILVAQGRRTFGEATTRVRQRALTQAHAKHQAINLIELSVDRNKHVQQAASLSRMSVTAWLPEVLVAARTAEDWFEKGIDDPWELERNYVMRVTGYDPGANDYQFSRAREYRLTKHLGQAVRIASSKKLPIIGRAARVVKEEILNPLGLTL